MKKQILFFSAVCTFACFSAQEDVRDPRVRTFIYPTWIVWQTSGQKFDDGWPRRAESEKMERLLERKFGQVCEGMFASKSGAKLVNRGEPAGVLLDFGREIHGGNSRKCQTPQTPRRQDRREDQFT